MRQGVQKKTLVYQYKEVLVNHLVKIGESLIILWLKYVLRYDYRGVSI